LALGSMSCSQETHGVGPPGCNAHFEVQCGRQDLPVGCAVRVRETTCSWRSLGRGLFAAFTAPQSEVIGDSDSASASRAGLTSGGTSSRSTRDRSDREKGPLLHGSHVDPRLRKKGLVDMGSRRRRRDWCWKALGLRPKVTLAILSIFFIVFGVVCARVADGTGANDMLTAAYVITTVITTVGYGDITVETEATRIGMTFYVLLLILVAAYGVRLISEWTLDFHKARLRRRIHQRCERMAADQQWDFSTLEKSVQRNDCYRDLATSTAAFLACVAFGTLFFRLHEHCACGYGTEWEENSSLNRTLCPEYAKSGPLAWGQSIDYEVCAAAGGWTKSYIDSFYMSVATVTTIGWGDFAPRTYSGRMVAIPWMIIGVFYAALFLSSISLIIFGTDDVIDIHLSVYRDEMLNRMLFESMDRYHNNVVARDEFLSFMLVQNGLVRPEAILSIDELFDRLREDSEEVSWDQMQAAMKTPEAYSIHLY